MPASTPPDRPVGRFVTIRQAAQHAAVCTKTIRRRIADGSLTGYRLGPRVLRVDLNEVDAMLKPIPTTRRPA